MKNRLVLFLALVLIVSCQSPAKKDDVKKASTTVRYAKHFRLVEKEGYTELVIYHPETLKEEVKYALVKEKNTTTVPKDLVQIQVPVKHIAAFSTSYVGMLNELDEINSISATTSEQYIYNAQLKKNIKAGKVLAVDYDGAASPSALLNKKVELIVFSGFGNAYPDQEKLAQLGIVCIPNYDWKELHPLGKAEWIKLFGALYGKEEIANAYFDEVQTNYNAIKASIAKKHKVETVILGGMFGDTWNATSGGSYLAGIVQESGMHYVYADIKGSENNPFPLSKIMRDEAKCSRWINAEAKSMNELLTLNPKFANFHTVKTKQVYSYFGKTNYFWEYNSMHPDWLLEDFARIGGSLPMKKMHFYAQLK